MAVTHVRSAGVGSSTNVSSLAVPLGATAAAGDLLVLAGEVNGATTTAAWTTPSGWSQAVVVKDSVANTILGIWWKVSNGTETGGTVAQTAGSLVMNGSIHQFSGFSNWLLDKTNTNDPAGTATSCAAGSTGTLGTSDQAVVALVGTNTIALTSTSWDSSFTNTTVASNPGSVHGWRVASATTALNPTASWTSGAVQVVGEIATFKQGPNPVTATFTSLWNLGGAVTKPFTSLWKVATTLTTGFTSRWDVKGTIGTFKIRAQVAWETDPLTRPGPGDWSEVGDVVKGLYSLNVKRGITILSAGIETGTATGVFDNATRALDPSYVTSPLYPNVKPRKRIRYVLSAGGEDIPVHTGFIERFEPSWSLASARIVIPSQDLLGILAGAILPSSVLDVETRALTPVAYWPLNEATGLAADDVVGTYDATYSVNAQPGAAIVPYVPLPVAQLYAGGRSMTVPGVSIATGQRSVSFWISGDPTEPITLYNPVFTMSSPSTSEKWIVAVSTTNTVRLQIINSGGTARVIIANTVIRDTRTHHVVVTVNATGNAYVIYVDGVAATIGTDTGSVTFSSILTGSTTVTTSFGNPGDSLNAQLKADVGQVALFDRVLTGTEVNRLYDAGVNPWDGDRTDERADRICDLVGIDPGDRDFDVGTQMCGPTLLGSQDALTYFKKIVATEAGVGYVTGDGRLRLRARPTEPVLVQTFTDAPDIDGGVPCSPLSPDYSYDRVVNTLTGKRDNGTEQLVVDPTSVVAYGPLSGAGGNLETLHRTAADLRTTLQLLINVRKDWGTYIPSVTVAAVDRQVTLDSLVHVEIGDLVSVRARPTGAVEELIFVNAQVEAVGYSFPAFGQLRTTYSLGDGVATEASFEWDTVGRGWDESYWLEGTPFAFDIEDHGWDSGFWTED